MRSGKGDDNEVWYPVRRLHPTIPSAVDRYVLVLHYSFKPASTGQATGASVVSCEC